MNTAICAAVIQYGQLLIVEKKNIWILPGGKPKLGENDFSCLRREVAEELSGTKIVVGNYYKFFKGITPHKKDELVAKVYFASLDGLLGNPSNEINSFAWMRYDEKSRYALSLITSDIVEALHSDKYF